MSAHAPLGSRSGLLQCGEQELTQAGVGGWRRCCPPGDQEYSSRLTECGLVGLLAQHLGRRWEPEYMHACIHA